MVYAWQNRIWIICPVGECEYLINGTTIARTRIQKKELSPESHDEAYTKAYTRYKDDPLLGTLLQILK